MGPSQQENKLLFQRVTGEAVLVQFGDLLLFGAIRVYVRHRVVFGLSDSSHASTVFISSLFIGCKSICGSQLSSPASTTDIFFQSYRRLPVENRLVILGSVDD